MSKTCKWGDCEREVVNPESDSYDGDLCEEHLSKFAVAHDGRGL